MIFTPLGHRIIVRYARKPFWSPPAPSKLFRIPVHTFYTPEEVDKIKKLNIDFRNQERVIFSYMKDRFFIPMSQAGGLPQEFIDKEQIIDEKIRKENDEENARVAKMREEFFSRENEEMRKKLLDEKMKREEELLEIAQDADDLISKSSSDPNSFITSDNIDAVIEDALENPVNYEFFIDRSGRKNGARLRR